MEIKNVVIAGAGVLGSQIAFQAARFGYQVKIWNRHVDRAEKRLANIKGQFMKDMDKTAEDYENAMDNIVEVSNDLPSMVSDADLVIEAVSESVEIKKAFFEELNEALPDHTIVASNSSTFMPSQLVKFTNYPERFLHMHYANHIWLHNVTEIVGTPETSKDVIDAVVKFTRSIDMVPIVLKKENPGYVMNALLIPLLNAAQSLWARGVADPHTIDKDWMLSNGSPMGPFMILDVVGLRTAYEIVENQYQKTKDPLAKKIGDNLKAMIDEGHTGVESGQGFYHYPNPEYKDPEFWK
ncbi:3-hydroxyacyl-CoA dehydrogenase [Limosilactobacillus coleohominis]|uniref:3-hydroxyacyl-CoA dehydrogenase n=1 Tax=Limosilactobacillus coleohominis TaxID=181675 RepID=A0ABS2GXA4_9LACO|nr:3-hydroxyacyl-CoA dehydrogenase [Limosilactobacillus coleohominis]MBM6940915.1 3-hydroxyacyl-CoA dehydrogenase [Limosilactobacillus coleohominis]MBM6955254.1 3-hydroxyacyl-CoA dehydrogenase [Limosilactobacillus coleohominis]